MGERLPDTLKDAEQTGPRATGAFVEGVSASMRPVEAVIRELSRSDVPVLLLAEPGAGKRATARHIHEMSGRQGRPFRCLPCSTLKPEDLTPPQTNGGGPNGGTIFLEELADLSPASQSYLRESLLHVTGRNRSGQAPTRFICGSARDLEVEVKAGRLREDLYYQISGVCLRLPPLRQRKEDILLLMAHFLRRYAEEFRRPVPEVSAEMERLFLGYSWPGNLRELESASRVLVALGDERLAMGGLRALLRQPSQPVNGGRVSLKAAAKAASHQAERELILKVLTRTRWNRRRAAAELQISYKALLYKLKQIGYEGYGAS